jgi:hypothetical protein
VGWGGSDEQHDGDCHHQYVNRPNGLRCIHDWTFHVPVVQWPVVDLYDVFHGVIIKRGMKMMSYNHEPMEAMMRRIKTETKTVDVTKRVFYQWQLAKGGQ